MLVEGQFTWPLSGAKGVYGSARIFDWGKKNNDPEMRILGSISFQRRI